MITITNKESVRSLTYAIHQAIKAKPNMKLGELREVFSKELGVKDWNALLGQFDESETPEKDVEVVLQNPSVDYQPLFHGELLQKVAYIIIDIFYQTEYWMLAPLGGSPFPNKESAIAFVEKFPNQPLVAMFQTNNSKGVICAILNYSDEKNIFLRDEETLSPIARSSFKNFEEIKNNLPALMTKRAEFEFMDDNAFAYPFIPKGDNLTNYLSSFDYSRATHGELSSRHANHLIMLTGTVEFLSLGMPNGKPFQTMSDAYRFVECFTEHPLTLIVDLGYFSLDRQGETAIYDITDSCGKVAITEKDKETAHNTLVSPAEDEQGSVIERICSLVYRTNNIKREAFKSDQSLIESFMSFYDNSEAFIFISSHILGKEFKQRGECYMDSYGSFYERHEIREMARFVFEDKFSMIQKNTIVKKFEL